MNEGVCMLRQLKKCYYQLRKKKIDRWNRVLPFSEYIVDRWEKAQFLKFGEGTSIYDNSVVLGDVRVGENTWIGPYTMLDGSGGSLKIGNHCSISTGVQIYTHDTVKYCVSGGRLSKEVGTVVIGDNCYIAPSSTIGKGVVLGKCCVVCAKSFVNKNFEDYSIIAGTPAKKIGEVVIGDDGTVNLKYYSRQNQDKTS